MSCSGRLAIEGFRSIDYGGREDGQDITLVFSSKIGRGFEPCPRPDERRLLWTEAPESRCPSENDRNVAVTIQCFKLAPDLFR